jgi:hypothetical protein
MAGYTLPLIQESAMFSLLERHILQSKGVTDDELAHFERVGIASKADFATVGTAGTLIELVGLSTDVAERVMAWATGTGMPVPASASASPTIVVDNPDVTYCVHCKARQPKDYSSGDLCGACGKQAEPTRACFWCGAHGPGQFCRGCGTRFVPVGEVELAAQLKRDGLPKDAIPEKLSAMDVAEKDALWARVRRR